MISKLLEKFGNWLCDTNTKLRVKKQKMVLAIGDWIETKQLKGCEPSKTKGLGKIFTRHNISYFLLDE